jgi:hypothetical protein
MPCIGQRARLIRVYDQNYFVDFYINHVHTGQLAGSYFATCTTKLVTLTFQHPKTPKSSLLLAGLTGQRQCRVSSHGYEELKGRSTASKKIVSWSCFLVELVNIVATKKIVADQNVECATTKNRDSARKIASIHHDISPVFLGGIQKVASMLTSLIRWRRWYVDVDSLD